MSASDDVAALWIGATMESLEYHKDLADQAIAQLSDEQLHQRPDERSNSVAIYMHHLGGNHLSRFTDFLSSDGEKSWRQRDAELADNTMKRDELMDLWERGWSCLLDVVRGLDAKDCAKTTPIRGRIHTVPQAIQRALAHAAYHCGQIVTTAKLIAGDRWRTITVPPGQSAAVNRAAGYDPAESG